MSGDACNFNNMEMEAVIRFFFPARQGPSFMKILTCGSSPRSGSRNAWTQIKNVKVPVVWATYEIFWHDPNDFLWRLVTMGETWLYHYDPETKQQSTEWQHSGSPCPKKFRVQKSCGKFLASIFWDHDSIVLINYLPKGQTINAECSQGTCNPEETGLPGLPMSWSPPHSLDLAPSDYHLFPGLKKQLKGCHFLSNTEVIAAVETWLDRQHSEFFLSGLQKLVQRAKKCMLNKSRVWSL